jgi:hypothetical protein
VADADQQVIRVFNGNASRFPSGVFTSVERAAEWIAKHGLTGVLTGYPVDEGAYDWAVRTGLFKVKHEYQRTAAFIGKFASGHYHHHFENGHPAA